MLIFTPRLISKQFQVFLLLEIDGLLEKKKNQVVFTFRTSTLSVSVVAEKGVQGVESSKFGKKTSRVYFSGLLGSLRMSFV